MILFETILPSGRGLRVEKVTPKVFMSVMERIGMKTKATASSISVGIKSQEEIMRTVVRAITLQPIPEQKKTEDGAEVMDFDATLDYAKENRLWTPVTYESMLVDGATEFWSLFDDLRDYNAAQEFIDQASGISGSRSPLALQRRQVLT